MACWGKLDARQDRDFQEWPISSEYVARIIDFRGTHWSVKRVRPFLIILGSVATALALAGALLPGLPTTPFLLVALWAFARSSRRLHDWLVQVPVLQSALSEAKRFEEKRALRPAIKVFALLMAWSSVALTGILVGKTQPILLAVVACAAMLGTLVIVLLPTDRA